MDNKISILRGGRKMKVSEENLKNIYENAGALPFINMNKENVKILRSIISELLELRAKHNEPIDKKKKLDELLSKITDENRHEMI